MKILTRYMLKEFFSFFIYCILGFASIFILIDIVENLDKLIDENIRINLIVLYYTFFLPYIIVLTIPVAMLLTTMFSLGRLVGDNEITAMKASGISFYRILIPLYVLSLFMGIIVMIFTEYVVPQTNRYREDIETQGNNFRLSLARNREMNQSHVFLTNGDGNIIYARNYDSSKKMVHGVFIIEPYDYSLGNGISDNTKHLGIKKRIDAEYMIFSDGEWNFVNVEERIFTSDGEFLESYRTLPAPFITVEPSDFASIDIKPEEMNYFKLRNYIKTIRGKGGDASEWLVDLYLKISFPFVSFIIVFFGAPLVAGSSKRGKTASFGIALVICFIYYSLINACQIIGRNGTLLPFAAAWLPNSLFFLVGLIMHFRANK